MMYSNLCLSFCETVPLSMELPVLMLQLVSVEVQPRPGGLWSDYDPYSSLSGYLNDSPRSPGLRHAVIARIHPWPFLRGPNSPKIRDIL